MRALFFVVFLTLTTHSLTANASPVLDHSQRPYEVGTSQLRHRPGRQSSTLKSLEKSATTSDHDGLEETQETAEFWNRFVMEASSMPDQSCTAELERFNVRSMIFDFEGPIGFIDETNIRELELVLKDAYNAVATCDQPNAFITVDNVTINIDIVDSIGNSISTGDDEKVAFTWIVSFEGTCRGCDADQADPPLFDDSNQGTCSCSFPKVEAFTAECNTRLASYALSGGSGSLLLKRVTTLVPGNGSPPPPTTDFTATISVSGSSGLFVPGGDYSLVGDLIMKNYNALSFLNYQNCDPEVRIITSVVPATVTEEEPEEEGIPPAFSVIFNIVGTCSNCGEATVIFGSHESSSASGSVSCPAGAVLTCPSETEFQQGLQELLQSTNSSISSAEQLLEPPCGDCDDGDLCTIDTCNAVTNVCSNVALGCGTDEVCDALSGTCENIQNLVPCVAVIDEWNDSNYAAEWATFRETYPKRPFCLLVPNSGIQTQPTGFANDTLSPDGIDRTISATVNRDGGQVSLASDWYDICDIGRFSASTIGFIGLFVDDSGSMKVSTVRASLDLFTDKVVNQNNLTIARVINGNERFITPFLTTLAP